MSHRRPLTGRGVGALVVGVILLVVSAGTGFVVVGNVGVLLLALVALCALVVHLPTRRAEVSRRVSSELLAVDETSAVELRLSWRTGRVRRGTWDDALPDAVAAADADAASGELPEGGGIRYDVTGLRRGVWSLGPLRVRTADAFGLAQRTQVFGEASTVTVVPAVVPLAPLAARPGAAGGTEQTSSRRLGPGADNLAPRPYHPGDAMRRIHWRATAHRGELMVRQEDEEAAPDAVVVLDRTAARWEHDGGTEAFDAACSACASVALHFVREGYGVEVRDATGRMLAALRGQEDEREELLVMLAEIAPAGGAEAPVLDAGSAPLVLLTGRLSAADAGALRRGAGPGVLLAADIDDEALAAAGRTGWSAARLGDDVAAAWDDALALTARSAGHAAG